MLVDSLQKVALGNNSRTSLDLYTNYLLTKSDQFIANHNSFIALLLGMAENNDSPPARYEFRARRGPEPSIPDNRWYNDTDDEENYDDMQVSSGNESLYGPDDEESEDAYEYSGDDEVEDFRQPPPRYQQRRPPVRRARRTRLLHDNASDLEYDPNDPTSRSEASETNYETGISDEENPPQDHEDGWSRVKHFERPLDQVPPGGPQFSGPTTGLKPDVPVFDRPVDAFRHVIDDSIIDPLIIWSHERAMDFFKDRASPKVHSINWNRLTPGEMYIFLAFILLMGIVRMPSRSMYWEHGPVFGGPAIFTGNVMSRNRFNTIMKFLRFGSVCDVDKKKPSSRIQKFLDLIKVRFESIIEPGENVGIDESLILWKGRLMFRQYIKTKRARFGIKIFFLCPSHPSWDGYSWTFEVYWGSARTLEQTAYAGLSKSEAIVVRLAQTLLDCGRHIFCDNWYSSVRLCTWLYERRTYFTGTINPYRGVPTFLRDEDLGRKLSSFVRRGYVLICKYVDRKTLYSITTKYKARCVQITKKYFRSTVFFNLPSQINQYNQNMGTVDQADQRLKYYSSGRKSLAWFKKLGLHFIDRGVLNSYLIFKAQKGVAYTKDFRGFVQDVASGLISDYSPAGKKIIEDYEKELRVKQAGRTPRQRKVRMPTARAPEQFIHGSDSSSDPSGPNDDDDAHPRRARGRGQRRLISTENEPAAHESSAHESSAHDSTQPHSDNAEHESQAHDSSTTHSENTDHQPTLQSPATSTYDPKAPGNLHLRMTKSPTKKKGKKAALRCKECYHRSKGKLRRETRTRCSICIDKPGLCSDECFETFHRRVHPELYKETVPTPVAARTRGRVGTAHRGPVRPRAEPQPSTSGYVPTRKRPRVEASTSSDDYVDISQQYSDDEDDPQPSKSRRK